MAAKTQVSEGVGEAVASGVEGLAVEIYDIERSPGALRVTLTAREGAVLDSALLAAATRAISSSLDVLDPIPGSYTLEVSSPGLERHLRRPDHFAGALGEQVSIRYGTDAEGACRVSGELSRVGPNEIEVSTPDGLCVLIPFDRIDRARTVVDWTRPGKPGRPRTGSTGTGPLEDESPHTRKATR